MSQLRTRVAHALFAGCLFALAACGEGDVRGLAPDGNSSGRETEPAAGGGGAATSVEPVVGSSDGTDRASPDPPEEPPVPGETPMTPEKKAEVTSQLVIGVNGIADQFPYLDKFLAMNAGPARPRVCHVYLSWSIADEPPGNGAEPTENGTRAFFEDWLRKGEGHCDEAMITFKALSPRSVVPEAEFTRAVTKFLDTPWKDITGFKGTMVYTPWNEPNNGDDAGNGLGTIIPPDVSARYFLAMERLCATRGCTVVSGDFASNGNMWDDSRINCADDDGDPRTLCSTPSKYNTTGRAPSYLDRYKNAIVNRAPSYGLPAGYRPKYFAYHGWHDINRYLNEGDHCGTYESCLTRRVLAALEGSWGKVEIWDNEVGVGQFSPGPSDAEQACGAAFLIRLTTLSPRITRLYYTRFRRGPGQLWIDETATRPAMPILAKRQRGATGSTCR